MDFLKMLATLLGKEPDELKNELGLDTTDDAAVAAHLMGLSGQIAELTGKVTALEEQVATAPQQAAVNSAVAGALGVDPTSDETAVLAKILTLQAGLAQHSIGLKLGLDAGADTEAILAKIGELQTTQNEVDCESLVANAIAAGKVPPAQKDFWLDAATRNPAAARTALDAMTQVVSNERTGGTPKPGDTKAPLSEADRKVMKAYGLTEEEFRRDNLED